MPRKQAEHGTCKQFGNAMQFAGVSIGRPGAPVHARRRASEQATQVIATTTPFTRANEAEQADGPAQSRLSKFNGDVHLSQKGMITTYLICSCGFKKHGERSSMAVNKRASMSFE